MSGGPRPGGDVVLALHEDTNANAALLVGGRVVAAVAEERLTRRRFEGGMPERAAAEVLRIGGLRPADVERVVSGNLYHFLPRVLAGRLPTWEHDFFGPAQKAYLGFHHLLSRGLGLNRAIEGLDRGLLARRLDAPVVLVDHHTAHAWSALGTSDLTAAVAVTIDNMGDGFSAKVFDFSEGRATFLYGCSAIESPGQFYGEVAQILGFHPLLAGKVTALAAFGDPGPGARAAEALFALDPSGRRFRSAPLLGRRRGNGAYGDLARLAPADAAAAVQRRFEQVVVGFVRHAVRQTGRREVALAGGVFANVHVNQAVARLDAVDRIVVHPAMSDQGIALGAAIADRVARGLPPPGRLRDLYLGPEYTDDEIGAALEEAGVRYRRCEDLEEEVARLLAEGRCVARFAGRLEYGPRALGNRSILYRPDDPAVMEWLNRKLRRAPFMPFAPTVLEDEAPSLFELLDRCEQPASIMAVSLPATERMKALCPGVVHRDGTARPQVLGEGANPSFHGILEAYRRRTGLPGVLNTSFNLHEEPIVCTPADAIRAFRAAGLDALAAGRRFLVEAAPSEAPPQTDEGFV